MLAHRSFGCAAVLLLAACGDARLIHSTGGLAVGARALAFPTTYVGFPTQASLVVKNLSRARQRAHLDVTPPFQAVGEIAVDPGDTRELPVTFNPTEPGQDQGTLRLSTEAGAIDVALSGLAKAPGACGPPATCRSVRFDPASGACVETTLADGTPCSAGDACLEGTACRAGECVGSARSCDDHDACTLDACSAEGGCTHTDVSRSCPAPSDPCKAATCDPQTGCGVGNAPDGTPCGSNDCITAHACMVGQCISVSVPDGAECAPATPCQAKGVCHDHVCEQPPAAAMTPVWTYTPAPGASLYFPGIADDHGNLYWSECGTTCQLVSATRDGFLRYRQTMSGAGLWLGGQSGGLMILSGDRVVMVETDSLVEAFRASDGSPAWNTDVALDLPPAIADGGTQGGHAGTIAVTQVVAGSAGQLFVSLIRESITPYTSWLVSLDQTTGSLLRWSQYDGRIDGFESDGQGTLYLNLTTDAASSLIAISEAGQERWRSATSGLPTAVSGEHLLSLQWNGLQIQSSADGGTLQTLPTNGMSGAAFGLPSPVLTATEGFAVTGGAYDYACGMPCDPAPGASVCDVPSPPALQKLDLATGSLRWSLPLSSLSSPSGRPTCGPAIPELQLTSKGSVLFVTGPPLLLLTADRFPSSMDIDYLNEVDGKGDLLYQCLLPTGLAFTTPPMAALHQGRWVIFNPGSTPGPQVQAFDLPGVEPAPSGWVAAWGSMARNGRPK